MPVLYLDSNIISYLHHPDNYIKSNWQQHLSTLRRFLDDPASEATVVYSPAHLMDVRAGLGKNKQQALEKLNFITEITKGSCLIKDIEAHTVGVIIKDAVDFFSRGRDTLEDFLQPGENGLDLVKIIEESAAFEKYKGIPIDYALFSKATAPLQIALARTKEFPTLHSVMCDLAVSFQEVLSNGHLLYKKLREKARTDTGTGSTIATHNDPLTALDAQLLKSAIGRRIEQVMMESFLSHASNRQEIVGSLFMHLDLFGFQSDKLTPGHGYTSVTTDAEHCFYASYCDIFVTQDTKTAAKAKEVYSFLNLDTNVMDIDQMAEWIRSKQTA